MEKIKYLGKFQIPNHQKELDLFECDCGYKTAVESGRFLNYEIYCNHCEQTHHYHLKEDERNLIIKENESQQKHSFEYLENLLKNDPKGCHEINERLLQFLKVLGRESDVFMIDFTPIERSQSIKIDSQNMQ